MDGWMGRISTYVINQTREEMEGGRERARLRGQLERGGRRLFTRTGTDRQDSSAAFEPHLKLDDDNRATLHGNPRVDNLSFLPSFLPSVFLLCRPRDLNERETCWRGRARLQRGRRSE